MPLLNRSRRPKIPIQRFCYSYSNHLQFSYCGHSSTHQHKRCNARLGNIHLTPLVVMKCDTFRCWRSRCMDSEKHNETMVFVMLEKYIRPILKNNACGTTDLDTKVVTYHNPQKSAQKKLRTVKNWFDWLVIYLKIRRPNVQTSTFLNKCPIMYIFE